MNKEEKLISIINSYSRKMFLETNSDKALFEYERFCIELIEENKQLKEEIKQYQKELEKADSITQSCIFQGEEESGISFRNCLNKMKDYKTRIDKAIEYLESYNVDFARCEFGEAPISIRELNELLEILKGE